jgi:flotillin
MPVNPIFILPIIFIIVFALVISILKCYRRCPSDKILVIYGHGTGWQTAICMHGGAAFVWPIIQDYQYLDLTPMESKVELKDVLCLDKARVDISLDVIVAISTDGRVMQNAAERLLGLDLHSIQKLANTIVTGETHLVFANVHAADISKNMEKIHETLRQHIESELKKFGLKLFNMNITAPNLRTQSPASSVQDFMPEPTVFDKPQEDKTNNIPSNSLLPEVQPFW